MMSSAHWLWFTRLSINSRYTTHHGQMVQWKTAWGTYWKRTDVSKQNYIWDPGMAGVCWNDSNDPKWGITETLRGTGRWNILDNIGCDDWNKAASKQQRFKWKPDWSSRLTSCQIIKNNRSRPATKIAGQYSQRCVNEVTKNRTKKTDVLNRWNSIVKPNFTVGDFEMIRNAQNKGNKLEYGWNGPRSVMNVVCE